jgi:hypothetical protein
MVALATRPPTKKAYAKWTRDEEDFLRAFYRRRGVVWCCLWLTRGFDEVRMKAKRMKIAKSRSESERGRQRAIAWKKQGLTYPQIAKRLGISRHMATVYVRYGRDGGRVKCRHCPRVVIPHRRGLCRDCYMEPAIRGLYPSEIEGRIPKNLGVCRTCKETRNIRARGDCYHCYEGMTEEELDALVERQYQCLPSWWPKETQAEKRRRERGIIEGWIG